MAGSTFVDQLKSRFGDRIVGANFENIDPWIEVSPQGLVDVCRHLRDDPSLAFDYLNSITGVDYLHTDEKKAAKSGGTTQFDVERIATYIEVMAGAGRQADARWLAERLFRIDGSNVAKEAVIRRLSRAGHTIESLSTPR